MIRRPSTRYTQRRMYVV